jgi:hypothetical protein
MDGVQKVSLSVFTIATNLSPAANHTLTEKGEQ